MSGLGPLRNAIATFARTPDTTAPTGGPHVRDVVDLKRAMGVVLLALAPCFAYAVHAHGAARMLSLLIVTGSVGLGVEWLFATLRGKQIDEGLMVTVALVALIVPVTIPLWQLAIGVAFAIVFGKEVFGGTGRNIFNPALVCRAFLFFAYPAQMTGAVWIADPQPPAETQQWQDTAFEDEAPDDDPDAVSQATPMTPDVLSQATPLVIADAAAPADAADALADAGYTRGALFFGDAPGTPGEGSKLAVLIGALVLAITGIGSLRIMVAGVVGLCATSALILALAPDARGLAGLMPWDHLLLGGFLFGIVFMATDPVSSPETDAARWVYGFACGAVTMLVRVFNPAYPEGTMLAILLMNAFAPALDRAVLAVAIRRRRARRA